MIEYIFIFIYDRQSLLTIASGSESKEKWEEEEMNNLNLQQCDFTKEY